MSERVLVTGGTGFVGGYVVRRLLQDGRDVRVVARHAGTWPTDGRPGPQLWLADVRDHRVLREAMQGVDVVLHLAACARAWARDPRDFASINVDAVRALLAAASDAGVARVVHVSTILTMPPAIPAARPVPPTPYEITKRAGERLVEDWVGRGGHAVIVHPTRVYGPGPMTDANGVTRAVAAYLAGRLRVRIADGDVRANYVHADDVAAGILLAARHGAAGMHYVLGDENASFRELLGMVSRIGATTRRMVPLPPGLAYFVGHACEWWGRLGGQPSLTRGWIRSFMEDRSVDVGPTVRSLGYRPRGLGPGLEETIAWLRAERGAVWSAA